MQKVGGIGFLTCEICDNNMTDKNLPISLSCGNTLCFNCYDKMKKEKSKCPFSKANETHEHLEKQINKNLAIIHLIEKISENNQNPNQKEDNDNNSNLLNKIKPIKNDDMVNDKLIYKGDLKSGKPFGKGQLIYDGLGIFKGEFDGEYHKGKGEIFYDDGSSYKGEWENFKRQNYGILTLPNLDRYEGEFKDDLYEGKGRLHLNDKNLIYEGFWRYGKKYGEFNIYNEFEELIKKENFDN